MSLYGDRGNLIVLAQRATELGLEVNVQDCVPGEPIDPDTNLILLGGGQDHDQGKILSDLLARQNEIKDLILGGAIFLGVCGGYQLLGDYYEDAAGNYLDGLKIVNIITKKAKSNQKRIIGNVKAISPEFGLLLGFENHGGRTYLGTDLKPMAKVLQGGGNNAEDGTEGVSQSYGKGFILGTYFHSFLAKNSQVADYLIGRSLSLNLQLMRDPIESLNIKQNSFLKY
jgi:lipid II isoglutaminyl synthase (glutamine-hydrolysing)